MVGATEGLAALLAAAALAQEASLERVVLLDGLAAKAGAKAAPTGDADLVHEVALDELARTVAVIDDRTRAFPLPLPVAHDELGQPLACELFDADGNPLELGFGHRRPKATLVPAEQIVDCLRHSAFHGFERRRFQTVDAPDGRASWIDRDADFALAFERFGAPARLWLVGGIVGGFHAELSPRVTLLLEGAVVGTKDCSRREELGRPFELPAASGTQKLVLRVAYPGGEAAPPRLALGRVRLREEPARDRLLLTTRSDTTGWRLRYRALPPPVVTAIDAGGPDGARRELRVAVLAGDAAIVVDPPQALAVSIDGAPRPAPDGPVRELPLRFARTGEHELVVSATRPPLAGRLWLVQPAADAAEPTVVAVQRERDTRPALVLAAGASIELALPEGGAGRLEAALAAEMLGGGDVVAPPGDVVLSLVDAGGAVVPLVARRVAANRAWDELEVALPAVGANAKLRVEARAPERMATFARTLRFLLADPTLLRERTGPRPRSVLVYLIDTLRADHCSAYGYSRRTTPALEEIAAEGVVFERTWAQAPWTRPAAATVLTGLLYPYHGAGKSTGLSDDVETLAERMRTAGRATAAFVANPHVYAGALQFEQGFGRFVTEDSREAQFRSDRINGELVPWLERHAREPFFVYVHTVDPHAAYDPPDATRAAFARADYAGPITPPRTQTELLREQAPLPPDDVQHVIDLYDEEILFNDRQLGVLRDEMKRIGVWDDTLVVVLSDHGEEFQEHGSFGHAGALWEELLHVPLVMKPPKDCRLAPTRVAAPARQMDVVPTALGLLAAPPGSPCQGIDLLPWIVSREREPLWAMAHEQPGMRCFVADGMKVIELGLGENEGARTLLFDLSADPREQHDLAAARADVARRLVLRMDAIEREFESAGFARHDGGGEVELAEHERDALRKLGYAGE